MIKLVLFDVGNVLIDLYSENARRSLQLEYQMPPESYEALSRSSYETEPYSITETAMIGTTGTDDYLEAFRKACGRFISRPAMKENRESILGRERTEMLRLLSDLKQRVRIAAFTNTIEMHWEILQNRDRFSFPTIVEQTIASHLIGLAKPTKTAYEEVARSLAVDLSEMLLIDDTEINISGAVACGMRGIVFTSYRELITNLRAVGLLH
jgi:FMN phosphatase YigB (HAD superfamily)